MGSFSGSGDHFEGFTDESCGYEEYAHMQLLWYQNLQIERHNGQMYGIDIKPGVVSTCPIKTG